MYCRRLIGDFPASALLLVFFMPTDSLLNGCVRRHLVLGVPKLIHRENLQIVAYRAIKNITQLSTIAEPTNRMKQYTP